MNIYSNNLHNLGQVPAHNIRHSVQIYAVDINDVPKELPVDQDVFTTSETLFPTQTNTRQTHVGRNVVIRHDPSTKLIRIKLKILYSGIAEDPNRYYYSVTLGLKPAVDLAALNRQGFGGVRIEQSDEGIEPK